jgi:fructan beta-fructosidase
MKAGYLSLMTLFLVFAMLACQTTSTTSSLTTTSQSTTTTISTTATSTTTADPLVVRYQREYAFEDYADVVFEMTDLLGEFVFLEGANVASGDYSWANNQLTFKRDFLVTLGYGMHRFIVQSTEEAFYLELMQTDARSAHKIVNGGFETGDLFGWEVQTVFKGETQILSFVPEGVVPNLTMFSFAVPYGGDGNFVYGMDDRDGTPKDQWNERIGQMRSSAFHLGGSGFITFKLGGARNNDLVYVSVREQGTDIEIARYSNPLFHSSDYLLSPQTYFEGNLVLYRADLTAHLGKTLYLELCDYGGRDWDLMTADSFVTYYETIPEDGVAAIDIKPSFAQPYVPNQVINGQFQSGLSQWVVSECSGWLNQGITATAFRVDGTTLKSDGSDVSARGMIRSGLFRVDGSGIISIDLGLGNGPRFDKDTYVSIREFGTNREVFRFANTRASGASLVRYYIDLSAHLGKHLYFEIVDNARTPADVVYVANIVTYYAVAPTYDYSQAGRNLNW